MLDGTPVACGLGIGRGPDVVFKVSFNIAIMSWVLSSNLENKTTMYSQMFVAFHAFEIGTP